MWLFDWVYGLLASLGLYHKEAKLLFLGLDNAGKTTLLNVLKEGRVVSAQPTYHPNQDELIVGKNKFKTFDLGGHEGARKLWREYFATGVDGVVFIVDTHDRERFPEAKKELDGLLSTDELRHCPFLVLGNKIDMGNCASEEELRVVLDLHDTTGKDKTNFRPVNRPVEVYMCSVIRKQGFKEGFQWLSNYL